MIHSVLSPNKLAVSLLPASDHIEVLALVLQYHCMTGMMTAVHGVVARPVCEQMVAEEQLEESAVLELQVDDPPATQQMRDHCRKQGLTLVLSANKF